MSIYIYTYIHTNTHTYMLAYMHACMHRCLHVHVHASYTGLHRPIYTAADQLGVIIYLSIYVISIAPLQGNYSEALPAQAGGNKSFKELVKRAG